MEASGFIQNLVTEYFGSHDQDRRLRVYRDISGQYSDFILKINLEIAELLVREGFNGGGVDYSDVTLDALIDNVFGNRGLAGSGRGGDDYGMAVIDMFDCLLLKTVVKHNLVTSNLVTRN